MKPKDPTPVLIYKHHPWHEGCSCFYTYEIGLCEEDAVLYCEKSGFLFWVYADLRHVSVIYNRVDDRDLRCECRKCSITREVHAILDKHIKENQSKAEESKRIRVERIKTVVLLIVLTFPVLTSLLTILVCLLFFFGVIG